MTLTHPSLIQGGMGIGVSSWTLARAVAKLGQLGVVSGTAVDTVFVRRLQDGDHGGHVRRAMQHFPLSDICEQVLHRYFRPEGRPAGTPYKTLPMYKQVVSAMRQHVTVLANFVEVWLAKEGHDGLVGINLLTKVQMPNLASLYGAMLAGVDYVLMGAGIPREIPSALDALSLHQPAQLKFDIDELPGTPAAAESELLTFDPATCWPNPTASLKRPRFLPIVSAHTLAITLARKTTSHVDGFVVEGATAGGHNAPPRGEPRFTESGEPIYGERDLADLEKMRSLELPFWLAGGMGSPAAFRMAREAGAAGVQVGTLFAYCEESGIAPEFRAEVLAGVAAGTVRVRTDPRASPTGYPFKVVEVDGMERQDDRRTRVCDLGYLRVAYRRPDGTVGYRCAAEPVSAYVAKGGAEEDTVGRRCLCNGLMANIGHAQSRESGLEPPLITSGDDLVRLETFLQGRTSYRAEDVVSYLLADAPVPAGAG